MRSIQRSKLGMCQWKIYERGASKMVYKRVRTWTSGGSLPCKTLLINHPPPPRMLQPVLVPFVRVSLKAIISELTQQEGAVRERKKTANPVLQA